MLLVLGKLKPFIGKCLVTSNVLSQRNLHKWPARCLLSTSKGLETILFYSNQIAHHLLHQAFLLGLRHLIAPHKRKRWIKSESILLKSKVTKTWLIGNKSFSVTQSIIFRQSNKACRTLSHLEHLRGRNKVISPSTLTTRQSVFWEVTNSHKWAPEEVASASLRKTGITNIMMRSSKQAMEYHKFSLCCDRRTRKCNLTR